MSSHYDVLIVGQGLAGTALAWSLRWLGARVLVIDRDQSVTSSKVSAGLITPVTGQKMARSWRFPELWPYAIEFYERVERETGRRFFRRTQMVRLFTSDLERARFDLSFPPGSGDDDVSFSSSPVDPSSFDERHGGFTMRDGGQLDVVPYLTVSRQVFEGDGSYRTSDLKFPDDVQFQSGRVGVSSLDVVADRMVLCQGIEGVANHWFRDVEFKPSKGEILTVRIPAMPEERVIHRGIWLAPLGNDLFKVGATYDWTHLDLEPTSAGRDEIVARLKEFLRVPFEVVGHSAAVRPIHRNQYPVMGFHPLIPELGYFNGLGSKGTLQAPFFSRQLSLAITGRGPVESDVDVGRKTKWKDPSARQKYDDAFHVKRTPLPLTQQAQEAVRQVVSAGEIVIDATMGNGYDTQFLAELVGADGTVYAFDVQSVALEKTRSRLSAVGLKNVILVQRCHAQVSDVIPGERHGHVAAVMFNLGYLPGTSKEIATMTATTNLAISRALALIRTGGVITIVAYTGHDGGATEAQSVDEQLRNLDPGEFEIATVESQPGRVAGPRMFVVRRRRPT